MRSLSHWHIQPSKWTISFVNNFKSTIKSDWTIDLPFQLFPRLKSVIFGMGRLAILFMTPSRVLECFALGLILLFKTSQVPVKRIALCFSWDLFFLLVLHVFNLSLINFDSQSLNKIEWFPLKQRVVIEGIAARAKEQSDLTLYSFSSCFFTFGHRNTVF